MFNCLVDLDLVVEKFLKASAVDHVHIDELNSYSLACLNVASQVYFAEAALAK